MGKEDVECGIYLKFMFRAEMKKKAKSDVVDGLRSFRSVDDSNYNLY